MLHYKVQIYLVNFQEVSKIKVYLDSLSVFLIYELHRLTD